MALDPYRELFERSADAILIIEGDKFVDCNQATVEMLRYENKEQLLRTHPSQLSPPMQPDGQDSFTRANEMMAIAFAKGSHRFEWDHTRSNGEVFPVEVLLTAVTSGGRRILHVVWRDISDRKRLEEAVRQSQKMEALGRLAGGIAHDFNNLLVVVSGNAEILRRQLSPTPSLLELVDEIRDAGQRAAALVRQLLTFSRREAVRNIVVDVGATVSELQKMLRRLIGEDVALELAITGDSLRTVIGAGHVEQVIVNLVTNARDAMPKGGTLTIEVRREDVAPGHTVAGADLPPGPYVSLAVRDTGSGMDAVTARRAFDPFFTTKEVGQGTGLGLATVYAVAKQSGGGAAIETAPGRGTTVRVYLPLTDLPLHHALSRPAPEALRGSEAILVVEDDAAVAAVTTRILGVRGYRVVLARDGVAALSAWR